MNPAALKRLREGGAVRLSDLLLDDLLSRPLSELVDAPWLAERLVDAGKAAARDPRSAQRLRDGLARVRKEVRPGPLPLPTALTQPVTDLLSRPYIPDRVLTGKILDHDTVRMLLRTLFSDLLVAFGRKLKTPSAFAGRTAPAGLLKLGRLGGEVLNAVGEGFEKHVEERAREFVDAGIGRLVGVMADHVSDPQYATAWSAYRVYAFEVIRKTEQKTLWAEVEKLNPDALVDTGIAVMKAWFDLPEAASEIEEVLRFALQEADGKNLRTLLGEDVAGLDAVRDLMRQRALAVVETEGFRAWWEEVVEADGG